MNDVETQGEATEIVFADAEITRTAKGASATRYRVRFGQRGDSIERPAVARRRSNGRTVYTPAILASVEDEEIETFDFDEEVRQAVLSESGKPPTDTST
jgi:hypothetical protein